MRLALAMEAALVAILVAGCSGGGGKGGGNGGDPPVADAGDNDDGRLFQAVTLDGSGSLDPEEKPLTFAWTVLSAPAGAPVTVTAPDPELPTATFTPDREGVYVFGLVVSDGKKESPIDTVEITVRMRVAVFGDPVLEQPLAAMLETHGSDPEGWSAFPDTDVLAADDTVFAMYDTRDPVPTLLAFDSATSNTFLLAFGDIDLTQVLVDSPYVIWNEVRNGQPDLFAHDVTTGQEFRLTNSVQAETLTDAEGGFAVWHEERDSVLYGLDVFAYELASGTEFIVAQTAEHDRFGFTNGTTIVYQSETLATDFDIWAWTIATETTFSLNTSAGAQLIRGIGGPKAVYVEALTGDTVIEDLSGTTSTITDDIVVYDIEGDYLLGFNSTSSQLFSLRLSTGATTNYGNEPQDVLRAGVRGTRAVWYDAAADLLRVVQLPAGVPVNVPGTANARTARITPNGVAWSSLNTHGVFDATFSSDNGGSTTSMSTGKNYLDTNLTQYDVVLLAGNLDAAYAADVVAAADAAGVPMLSATTDYGAGDIFEAAGLYGIDVNDDGDCGPNRVVTSVHEVFDEFALGIALVLDDVPPEISFEGADAKWFDSDGAGTLPADYQVVASFDLAPCTASSSPAIVTFSTPSGTQVLLDGAANGAYDYAFWSESRKKLLREELLWLVSTAAP